MDADALPPEARELMVKLFAQAPRAGYAEIAEMVRAELGKAPEEAFARFDREPLAAASLGQVHRAQLHDGTEVAVKVQYPGVAQALMDDLKNASVLARVMGGAGKAAIDFDPTPYYAEIRAVVEGELDYRREAKLGAAYSEAVSIFPELHVPRVFTDHSAGRVLTMEFAPGQSISAFATSESSPEARWRVGRQMAIAVMGPMVRRELVHGDPHPGNFLVRDDGRLTVLDFGAVKQLSPQFVRGFWALMECAVDRREPDFMTIMSGMGFGLAGDPARLTAALSKLHAYVGRPIFEDEYDWGSSTLVPEVRMHVAEHVRDLAPIKPPVESVFFYRALGGLAQNLKSIRARGPYRELVRELSAHLRSRLPPSPAGATVGQP
jgi:predicted unusual protein kinase regulating ubiquinone biosynthesis (AarF/ABC1/UbiB family)